jgi:hypothetical protein
VCASSGVVRQSNRNKSNAGLRQDRAMLAACVAFFFGGTSAFFLLIRKKKKRGPRDDPSIDRSIESNKTLIAFFFFQVSRYKHSIFGVYNTRSLNQSF